MRIAITGGTGFVGSGRRPLFVGLPIAAQLVIARLAEWTMRVPLIVMPPAVEVSVVAPASNTPPE